jgi:hypothetical protein
MTNEEWNRGPSLIDTMVWLPLSILIIGLWYLFWGPIVFICVLVEKLGWSKG